MGTYITYFMLKKVKTRKNKDLSAPQNGVTCRNRRDDKVLATSPLTSIRVKKRAFKERARGDMNKN
jgi:hypothetical protein